MEIKATKSDKEREGGLPCKQQSHVWCDREDSLSSGGCSATDQVVHGVKACEIALPSLAKSK